jgi:hypothetical protein
MTLMLLPPQNFVKTTMPTISLTENYNKYQDKLLHSGMLFSFLETRQLQE